MRKFHFIVNPVAGTGRGEDGFLKSRAVLDRIGADYSYAESEYAGHAVKLTEDALKDGKKCIVAVGGDGTVNEVCKTMIGSDAALGILPFGTGNDLARALKLSTDPEKAVMTLVNGVERRMDLCTANDMLYTNVGGFGFDTDVVINTEKFKKRFNGMLPYMLGVIQSVLHLKPMKMHITADGREFDEEALLIAAANGTHYGGGMNVAPQGDPFDGLMDICIVKKVGVLRFLSLLPRFVKGKHIGLKPIGYFKAKQVHIESSDRFELNLDGELGSSTPVTFKVLPSAIGVIINA